LSTFILGNTVLQFPVGWLADHVPKHMVSAGCCAVTAIACGLIPYFFGTWMLWPILTVAGAASAGIYTVALSELGDRFSGHELVTGTACFSVTWGLGALLGALLAGWSIAAFGPDGLPYALAALFAAFFLGAFTNSRRKPA
ncbi:MAG: MFS transporter, partial [Aestuariivirga sp.]